MTRRTDQERARRAAVADMSVGEGPEWHDSAPLPVWLPPSGIRTVASDDFETITVFGYIGAPAIRLLGDRSGPVIANDPDGTLTWFLAPGAAAGWDMRQVQRTAPGSEVRVPAADVPHNWWLHWRVPPRGDCLTDADALHDALAQAIAVQCGPRPEAGR